MSASTEDFPTIGEPFVTGQREERFRLAEKLAAEAAALLRPEVRKLVFICQNPSCADPRAGYVDLFSEPGIRVDKGKASRFMACVTSTCTVCGAKSGVPKFLGYACATCKAMITSELVIGPTMNARAEGLIAKRMHDAAHPLQLHVQPRPHGSYDLRPLCEALASRADIDLESFFRSVTAERA